MIAMPRRTVLENRAQKPTATASPGRRLPEQAREHDRGCKGDKPAEIKSGQHGKVKSLGKIKRQHGAKQKNRHGDLHGEGVELIGEAVIQIAGFDCEIADSHDNEDRQDGEKNGKHLNEQLKTSMDCAYRSLPQSQRAEC